VTRGAFHVTRAGGGFLQRKVGRLSSWDARWAIRRSRGLVAVILFVAFGAWLRLAHLDAKVYWHDEAHTSLRIFGYPFKDLMRDTFTGEILTVDALQRYQRPRADKGLGDTLALLAQRPEHGPVYYLLAHFWARWCERPQVGARAVSAVVSLLLMPLMYLLAWELFQDRRAAGLVAALVSVSPLHLLYAQEAREYALWAVVTAGSSLALLRAARTGTKRAWRRYTLTLVVGLYSHLLILAVVLGHGLYLVTSEPGRRRSLKPYALALAIAGIVFAPWASLLWIHSHAIHDVTGWMSRDLGLAGLARAWLQQLGRLFFDFPSGGYWWLPSVAVLAAAGYTVRGSARSDAGRFVMTLVAVCAAVVILPDVVAGGRRSAEARYLMPVWLGLQLMVADAASRALRTPERTLRALACGAVVVVVLGGVMSCLAISWSETWWTKGVSYFNPELARIINRGDRPLVVSSNGETNPGDVLSLSYLLEPKVRLILADYGHVPEIPAGFSDVFLFNPGWEIQAGLRARYRLEAVHSSGRLSRLVAQPAAEHGAPP